MYMKDKIMQLFKRNHFSTIWPEEENATSANFTTSLPVEILKVAV